MNILREEESIWYKKSKVSWLSQRDRNTKFFSPIYDYSSEEERN